MCYVNIQYILVDLMTYIFFQDYITEYHLFSSVMN